ncbi:UDP-N-acetylglucosamine 2-epimerase (non-hydrolyzing) [archaeon]|jgi:UDP-N-acetylglucosamine 2-epimerase (non-hydrolysing)|nr:UDP-N-acetylglucosamine 2-epimerase (non-hydrolyzing) [archaeon]
MVNKSKIAIIIGTRAELIKTFPVMQELKKQKIPYYFIHTGQHNLQNLCEKFNVKKPDAVLTLEPEKTTKLWSKINQKSIGFALLNVFLIRKELKKLKNLKYVLYHGDTMTTSAAAIGSSKLLNPFKKYKNVHLEAGLRSEKYFEPFPEEISRIIAGKFSDILFAVSKRSKNNLKKYVGKKNIIQLGNTVVDSIHLSFEMAKKNKTKRLNKEKFALVVVHRHENLKNKTRLSKIVEIISSLELPTYFAMHDSTEKQLKTFGLYDKLISNKRIKIIPNMEYTSFIYQIKNCSLILCDGGSLQEESLVFNVPCILFRKATERQEALETNFQFLSGLKVKESKKKIQEYLNPKFKPLPIKNPYGEVGLTKKVVEVLKK